MTMEALKEKSSGDIMAALVVDAPKLMEWISSDDLNPESVERGRQLQALLDAARKPYIEALEELVEVLTPFALMATAYENDGDMDTVAERGVQGLTVSALRLAREQWLKFHPERR